MSRVDRSVNTAHFGCLPYVSLSCENAIKTIDEAMVAPNVSDKARRDAAKRLNELSNHKYPAFDNYDTDIMDLAYRAKALCLSDEEALAYLEDLLARDFNSATLIKQKYKLLVKMGRTEEAESFLEENVDNYDVSDYYVNMLFEEQRFEKLIPILKYITDPDYETYNRPTHRWLEILAKCQEQVGEVEDLIKTYARLFIRTLGGLGILPQAQKDSQRK